MNQPSPLLFDPVALRQRRARMKPAALFLHDAARDEVQDRLSLVNKSFKAPAIVAPFPDVWRDLFPDAVLVTDDEVLALEPGAHDLVVHAMALHAANDPVGQIIQARRALVPDGLFLGLFLGARTLHELRAALGQAEVDVTGGLSPRFAPMVDVRDAGALLQRAGLAMPVADVVALDVAYRDIWHLMRDLRAMGEANALTGRLRYPTRRAVFDRAQAVYAQAHTLDSGRLTARFDTIVATGWAPDDTQPKPLRPGSAQASLADALGATEVKLPD